MEQHTPFCLDGRMLAADATGVATYARTALAALRSVDAAPMVLDDATRGRFGTTEGRVAEAHRWLRSRMVAHLTLSGEPGGFVATDVFRLAQARFAATGTLLRLRVPGPPGVMHWTYPIPAIVDGWRNLYTIHDVIPLTDAGLSAMAAAPLRARLCAIVAAATGIVTVSEYSRREIVDALEVDPNRVCNAGLAVDVDGAAGPLASGLESDGYYLFHGMIEPRKNLARIVAAWRASGTALPLVLAGPDGGDVPVEAGVVRLRYLPRAALLSLVAQARALVFPSLAEGFGLPIAEAMALGTPVITSDRGATAQTAGGAALLVDPENVDAIAAALRRIEHDAGLRAALVEAGRRRAAEAFALPAFGRRLLACYADFSGDLPSRA